jgi:simple sugar transport system ATP-binding protein
LTPVISLRGVSRRFGSLVANDGVDLTLLPGRIHGVVGENGAGKSTLMKIVYGMVRPDDGLLHVDGKARAWWRSPREAIQAGIGMVHQHFMLAGPETALDNVILGEEASRPCWNFLPRFLRPVDRKAVRTRLEKLSSEFGFTVDWDAPVESLPVGVQQRLEILKLLDRHARVLILDEPTAVLTPQETDELFKNLRKLAASGRAIVVITHKLREVMQFTDEVTILRAGRVTARLKTAETSAEKLAEAMVGRKVVLRVDEAGGERRAPRDEKVLEVEGLGLGARGNAKPKLDSISFQVRSGEVVGIAGVEGNGQSELIQALAHPGDPVCRESGSIRLVGVDITRLSDAQVRAQGLAIIPEDRQEEGLLMDRSLRENFILGLQRDPRYSSLGLLRSRPIQDAVTSALEDHDVRPRNPDAHARGLSGGNQQKLVIAREFSRNPKFLIASQPTRGVDVGAIESIHARILKAREEGAAVLLLSSELDEVMALSDRVLVIYEGKIVAEHVRRTGMQPFDEKAIGLGMSGVTS